MIVRVRRATPVVIEDLLSSEIPRGRISWDDVHVAVRGGVSEHHPVESVGLKQIREHALGAGGKGHEFDCFVVSGFRQIGQILPFCPDVHSPQV